MLDLLISGLKEFPEGLSFKTLTFEVFNQAHDCWDELEISREDYQWLLVFRNVREKSHDAILAYNKLKKQFSNLP